MVDALDSKSNIRKSVKVQVLSPVFLKRLLCLWASLPPSL